MANRREMSDADHAKRQKEAATARENSEKGSIEDVQSGFVNTQLTTAEHVGGHPNEPDKPKELSLASTAIEDVSGVTKIKTVDRKTAGETTDKVVVDPPSPAVRGATAPVKSEATKVQEAAAGKTDVRKVAGKSRAALRSQKRTAKSAASKK
jgi:hypothetical protein